MPRRKFSPNICLGLTLATISAFSVGLHVAHSSCSTLKCDHVEYAYLSPLAFGEPEYCYEFSTSGADSLLPANHCALTIFSTMPVDGTPTSHPSIQVRKRVWTSCAQECQPVTVPIEFYKATVSGTAGNWTGYLATQYCATGG